MYITLFERVSSLQSRLFLEVLQQSYWKMHAFFKRIDSIGKCNILQKYFDLEVTVSIPKYSMFFLGGFRYIKMQDYFTYLLHAPLEGYVIYINEKWTEWRWKNTYIKWKISSILWIKYTLICNLCLSIIFQRKKISGKIRHNIQDSLACLT